MISIEIRFDDFEEKFKNALDKALERAKNAYIDIIDNHFIKDNDWPYAEITNSPFEKPKIHFPKKTSKIRIRTGRLKSHIKIEKLLNGYKFFVDDVIYARLIHQGGTVKPTKRKYLAIGIQKDTYLIPPSEYPAKLFAKNGFLWEKLGNNAYRPVYLLAKKVEIPARPFLLLDKDEAEKVAEKFIKTLSGF